MNTIAIMDAMRVPPSIAPQKRGPWEIVRLDAPDLYFALMIAPYRSMTALCRHTMETLHREHGESVMEDSPRELARHFPIMTQARGRILISGLGLGCVVRGLLANPAVTHVDVVEIDLQIVRMVWPEFARDSRVTLHIDDIRTWAIPAGARWDFAWHDVWSDTESLAVIHANLLLRFRDYCDRQGAWNMPRFALAKMPHYIIGGPRRRRIA